MLGQAPGPGHVAVHVLEERVEGSRMSALRLLVLDITISRRDFDGA
jgi:hypothetical protein